METDKSFRDLANKAFDETMKELEFACRGNMPLRHYIATIAMKAYLEGLHEGYWKGIADAKESLYRQHVERCKKDFEYWLYHNCRLKGRTWL